MRCSVSASDTSPRAWVAMKLIALGRRALGGDEQIAFVLAVFVVDQDQHAAFAHVGQKLLDDGFAGFFNSLTWQMIRKSGAGTRRACVPARIRR